MLFNVELFKKHAPIDKYGASFITQANDFENHIGN